MQNNFNKLFNQVNKQIEGQLNPTSNSDINPLFKNTSFVQKNIVNTLSATNTQTSYQWLVVENIDPVTQTNLILTPDIFTVNGIKTKSFLMDASDGDIAITTLDSNSIYLLSCIITRSSNSTTAPIKITWNGDMSVYVNGSIVTINQSQAQIPLIVGQNIIEIIISTGNSTAFTTSGKLGKYADVWRTPSFNSANTPQNLNVRVDPNAAGSNTNINIVKWDMNADSYTLGYKIYRRGPYNYLTTTNPSGISQSITTSGNLSLNTQYYYAISAYGNNGESLPYLFTQSVITPKSYDPPIYNFNMAKWNATGSLTTGVYYYGVSYFAGTKETTLVATCSGRVVPQTSAILGWEFPTDSLSGIYNFNPSGIRIYRSQTYNFGASSLLTIITGINTLSYIDTGNVTTTGQPLTISTLFSGIGVNLSWAPAIGDTSGYYIYRSNINNYATSAFLTSVSSTQTSFFDSGYVTTTGVPTTFKQVSDVVHPTNRYDDIGVKYAQQYDYMVTSYNNLLIESPQSTQFNLIAGDIFPPNPPSGITLTTNLASINLSWQNGVEPDLAGTKIYYSPTLGGTYSQVGNTKSTSFAQYIGYSSTAYFKLANYDIAGNISTLTGIFSGVTTTAPITSVPPVWNWGISFSKNPTTTGFLTITVVSPTPITGTPTIQVQQMGQGSYSSVLPVTGTSPTYSGVYTVVSSFDGPAAVLVSGISTGSAYVISSSTFTVDTVAPTQCYISFQ